ncbi:PREDICTED: uncharacterized protein LOC109396571 isoform X2 [Hipposideros armiger]|uniref:Uncharacterized protein LOC109396571 isoform X2 n=1 Tax=Hipposideros armiger TaxID=186990 RepID=A0A8B7TFX0_HIPAR|nr:PREDICTED: uncharacterized protein LOC109396571 isoform X2 [Hipposideros armiger]
MPSLSVGRVRVTSGSRWVFHSSEDDDRVQPNSSAPGWGSRNGLRRASFSYLPQEIATHDLCTDEHFTFSDSLLSLAPYSSARGLKRGCGSVLLLQGACQEVRTYCCGTMQRLSLEQDRKETIAWTRTGPASDSLGVLCHMLLPQTHRWAVFCQQGRCFGRTIHPCPWTPVVFLGSCQERFGFNICRFKTSHQSTAWGGHPVIPPSHECTRRPLSHC